MRFLTPLEVARLAECIVNGRERPRLRDCPDCVSTICGTQPWRYGSPQAPNVKDVSARAGHTSAAFTLDRYGHRFDSADDALAPRLDDVFVDAPTNGLVVLLKASDGLQTA